MILTVTKTGPSGGEKQTPNDVDPWNACSREVKYGDQQNGYHVENRAGSRWKGGPSKKLN